jgi:transcriptional regulator GlxA family with amidase domain
VTRGGPAAGAADGRNPVFVTHTFQSSPSKPQPHCSQAGRAVAAEAIARFAIARKPEDQLPAGQKSEARESAVARHVAVCLDYMRNHLNQPLKISDLSALVGLSESSIFVLFRRAMSDTPLNWFIRARMQRAAELLETTSLPVKGVAAQIGYHDPFYFSRMFKSVHGVAPMLFRTQKQSQPARTPVD